MRNPGVVLRRTVLSLLLIHILLAGGMAHAARQKVILDTDIADDVDDAYALALLASLPEADILGVTTVFGETEKRARLAAKLLKVLGRSDLPVLAGRKGEHRIGRQYEWARDFRSDSLKSEDAVEFIRRQAAASPGEVTLICVGPLTNAGDLFTRYPETKKLLKRLVLMGGAVHVGYDNKPPAKPEWNIRCDLSAAAIVFSSGVPLVMAGLEVTTMMKLDPERQKRLFATGSPVTDALAALTILWGKEVPTLYDPVAVAHALGHVFSDGERRRVEVEKDGLTRLGEGDPNVTLLVHPRRDAFLDFYVSQLQKSKR